ncbi:MAG TPA: MarP family serine protease [Jatrophihabitans sp.]|nr:MarP family serine protease [Jatrophihabitans sp.]
MNILDLIIIVLAIAYGIAGFRSGALVGICSLVGFLGGAMIGAQLARPLGSSIADGRAQVPVAVVCVLVCAMACQLLAVFLAGLVRGRLLAGRARPLDAGVGALLGVVSVLLVSWMIAVPLASSPFPRLAAEASQSRIVRAVNNAVPDELRHIYASLRTFFDQSGFPPVLGDLPSTSLVPVEPPSDLTPAVRQMVNRVHESVVKIYGQAPSCNRQIEGSGFVYARHRVLTNAHVVAGTSQVTVQVGDGVSLSAKVVVYDPERDVAVLDVPQLSAPALPFRNSQAQTGESSVVLGYPEDGPFTAGSARVRSQTTLSGRDIYDDRDVQRSIYSVRATVRSGNSGGPLVDTAGRVLGMVFARSLDSSDTGFALTNGEIRGDAARGRVSTAAVSTQSCTTE